MEGLKVNFLVHLQSFAGKFFPPAKCLRDMDDSNSQTFLRRYFFHLQMIKIACILWVCEHQFQTLLIASSSSGNTHYAKYLMMYSGLCKFLLPRHNARSSFPGQLQWDVPLNCLLQVMHSCILDDNNSYLKTFKIHFH